MSKPTEYARKTAAECREAIYNLMDKYDDPYGVIEALMLGHGAEIEEIIAKAVDKARRREREIMWRHVR